MMNQKSTPQIIQELKAATEEEIKRIMERELLPEYRVLHDMLVYQMRWDGSQERIESGGKRLRPIFLLLSCQAMGGKWKNALPAAAAVELLHNFTLIHDDIQDQSPTRHGRASVWKKWNPALAINAGDAMFSLANLALMDLQQNHGSDLIMQTQQVMLKTCIQLTYGQHLDISNEGLDEISIEDYLTMIEGKTAALIGASMEMGVILSGGSLANQKVGNQLGLSIGMAFQVIDDILGIWGEAEVTGKSNESDLINKKLSLPIIFGLRNNSLFSRRWKEGPFKSQEIPELARILEEEGARSYAEKIAQGYTDKALSTFSTIDPKNDALDLLKNLCEGLISRNF